VIFIQTGRASTFAIALIPVTVNNVQTRLIAVREKEKTRLQIAKSLGRYFIKNSVKRKEKRNDV
jgi:hypothetical protein